jgi:hydroxyacylglutathione hydrolase
MLNVVPIPILNDNYIWTIIHGEKTVVIDPGLSDPVLKYHQKYNLELTAILITHHHHDHIGGIDGIINQHNVPVYAPYHEKFNFKYHQVQEKSKIQLFDNTLEFSVIEVPGHTLEHIIYHGNQLLFCGDTLFSFGCGRIFEGTYRQMYDSLKKFKSIDPDSKVYCTHEYTLKNLEFLKNYFKDNTFYKNKYQNLSKSMITLPSLLKDELESNPFLNSSYEEFKKLREAKDLF